MNEGSLSQVLCTYPFCLTYSFSLLYPLQGGSEGGLSFSDLRPTWLPFSKFLVPKQRLVGFHFCFVPSSPPIKRRLWCHVLDQSQDSRLPQRLVCATKMALCTSVVLTATSGCTLAPTLTPTLTPDSHWPCQCFSECCKAALISDPPHRCPASLVHVARNASFFPKKSMGSVWV